MRIPNLWAMVALSLALAGCTSTEMYRSRIGEECNLHAISAKNTPSACETASIERAKDFDIAYVELTDQGWFYKRQEMTAALNLLAEKPEDALNIVVFIHGWKHSARFNDENVTQFRKAILPTLIGERASTRTVGIYVGWRGASLDVPSIIQNITFYDRKATAEHVARGSIRELLSHLQAIRNKNAATPGRKVTLTLIGHSFGGLILYNAIAESLLNNLVTANHGPSNLPRMARPVADMVLLLNPAFEASRFEPLFQVAKDQLSPNGNSWVYSIDQRPIFVSITSDADLATKTAFRLGRAVNSFFEHEGLTDQDDEAKTNYGDRLEKVANTHTIGHMARYRTHHLELSGHGSPSATGAPIVCKHWPNSLVQDENVFPLWNMFAMKPVIHDHNDIYGENLWSFISQVSNAKNKLSDICSK